MGHQLPQAPLVEALLELRWDLRPTGPGIAVDPGYPLYPGILYQNIRTHFPHVVQLPASYVPEEVIPHTVTQQFRKGPDAWPLVQCGPGVATLNYVRDVYSWDAFEEDAASYFSALGDAYQAANDGVPPLISASLLRYINAVPMEWTQPSLLHFLSRQLHVAVDFLEASEVLPETLQGIQLSCDYTLNSPLTRGSLRFGTGNIQGDPSLLFEILVSSSEHYSDRATFTHWLTGAHDVAESWFFALIKGDLEVRFRGDSAE